MLSINIPSEPTKCGGCRKKFKLVDIKFDCKCCLVFCMKCRMPEDHACCHDFKKDGELELKSKNPIVVAKKIDHI